MKTPIRTGLIGASAGAALGGLTCMGGDREFVESAVNWTDSAARAFGIILTYSVVIAAVGVLYGLVIQKARPRPKNIADYPLAEAEQQIPETSLRAAAEDRLNISGHRDGKMAGASLKSRSAPYVLRHWRGELNLAVSYWVNGLLLSVIATTGEGILGDADITQHPRAITAGYASVSLLLVPVTIWQLMGIWRAATRTIEERKRLSKTAPWAGLARVTAFLGLLSLVVNTVAYRLPYAWANLQIAFGVDATPHHLLQVLNGGREVEIARGIDFGTAADLSTLLDALPNVEVVDLDNLGGRVAEALRVRDIIREKRLAAYTTSTCASACTVAYMGGNPRYLGPSGRLGFHRYSFPGLTPEQEEQTNRQGANELMAAGVTPAFAAKVFSTPATDIWFPDNSTLLVANVVTQVTDGMAFSVGAGANARYTVGDAEREIDTNPSFAALKRHDPVSYNQVINALVAGMRQGKSLQDLISIANGPLIIAVTKYRALAGDDVQVQLASVTSNEARLLAPQFPAACVTMLSDTAQPGEPPYTKYLPTDAQKRDVELTAAVIDGGASNPSYIVATEAVANVEIARIWAHVRTSTGLDLSVLTTTPTEAKDKRTMCLAMAAFFDEVVALPRQQAGALMRYLNKPSN